MARRTDAPLIVPKRRLAMDRFTRSPGRRRGRTGRQATVGGRLDQSPMVDPGTAHRTDADHVAASASCARGRRLFRRGHAIGSADRHHKPRPGRLSVSSDGAVRVGLDTRECESDRRNVGDGTDPDRVHQVVDDRGRDHR